MRYLFQGARLRIHPYIKTIGILASGLIDEAPIPSTDIYNNSPSCIGFDQGMESLVIK